MRATREIERAWGLPSPLVRVGPPEGRVAFGYQGRVLSVRDLVWQLYADPMSAVAQKWLLYNKFKEYAGDGTIDLDNDTFKIGLYLSSSNAATLTNSVLADLTNEHANANGYTTGGNTLANVTWTESSGTVTLDADDTSWTASGGSITARFAVIYDDTPTSPADPLVCYSLLDTTPADVTATDGNVLAINFHSSGIIAISGGATP